MKKVVLKIVGYRCSLEDCPPGPFLSKGELCFKSEYSAEIQYYTDSGEALRLSGDLVYPLSLDE